MVNLQGLELKVLINIASLMKNVFYVRQLLLSSMEKIYDNIFLEECKPNHLTMNILIVNNLWCVFEQNRLQSILRATFYKTQQW